MLMRTAARGRAGKSACTLIAEFRDPDQPVRALQQIFPAEAAWKEAFEFSMQRLRIVSVAEHKAIAFSQRIVATKDSAMLFRAWNFTHVEELICRDILD